MSYFYTVSHMQDMYITFSWNKFPQLSDKTSETFFSNTENVALLSICLCLYYCATDVFINTASPWMHVTPAIKANVLVGLFFFNNRTGGCMQVNTSIFGILRCCWKSAHVIFTRCEETIRTRGYRNESTVLILQKHQIRLHICAHVN